MLGAYYDPIVVGLELVDSDILSALDDLRKDGIGDVRITNTAVYAKVFIAESFYIAGTSEQRRLELYNRGYIKYGQKVDVNGKYEPAQAYYDMTIETSVYTIGVGFQKFSENMFTSFDFLRWTSLPNSPTRLKTSITISNSIPILINLEPIWKKSKMVVGTAGTPRCGYQQRWSSQLVLHSESVRLTSMG